MSRGFFSSVTNIAPKYTQHNIRTICLLGIGIGFMLFNFGSIAYRYASTFRGTDSEQYLQSQEKQGDDLLKQAEASDDLDEKLMLYKQAINKLGSTGRAGEVVPSLEHLYQQTSKTNPRYPHIVETLAGAYFAASDYDQAIKTQKELIEMYKSGKYKKMPYSRADAQDKLSLYEKQTSQPDLSIPDPTGVYDR